MCCRQRCYFCRILHHCLRILLVCKTMCWYETYSTHANLCYFCSILHDCLRILLVCKTICRYETYSTHAICAISVHFCTLPMHATCLKKTRALVLIGAILVEFRTPAQVSVVPRTYTRLDTAKQQDGYDTSTRRAPAQNLCVRNRVHGRDRRVRVPRYLCVVYARLHAPAPGAAADDGAARRLPAQPQARAQPRGARRAHAYTAGVHRCLLLNIDTCDFA